MRRIRLMLGCLASCVAVGGALAAPALGAEAGSGVSWLGGPLVVQGSPTEAQERQAARASRYASSAAFSARLASASAFEGLSPSAAEGVIGEAFSELVEVPAGGVPPLPAGERVAALIGARSAQLS